MPRKDHDVRRLLDRERARRRTARRIANGRCPRCGKRAPAPGRRVCDSCAGKRRAADRARAAERRQAGIKRVKDPEARKAEYRRARQRAKSRLARRLCARCGRFPHEPDRRLCASCGQKQRRADRARYARVRTAGFKYGGKDPVRKREQARRRTRERQRARRADGRCIRCGDGSPVDGGLSCAPCLENRRASDRQTYAERRAAGLCTRCGNRSFEGAPVCGPCTVIEDRYRETKNEAGRNRYAQRRAAWICTHCGRRPSFGASRCEHYVAQPIMLRRPWAWLPTVVGERLAAT